MSFCAESRCQTSSGGSAGEGSSQPDWERPNPPGPFRSAPTGQPRLSIQAPGRPLGFLGPGTSRGGEAELRPLGGNLRHLLAPQGTAAAGAVLPLCLSHPAAEMQEGWRQDSLGWWPAAGQRRRPISAQERPLGLAEAQTCTVA